MSHSVSIKLPRTAVNAASLCGRVGKRVINANLPLLAGFALLLLMPAVASAQSLVNPGFESTPDLSGWTLSAGGVGSAPTTLGGSVNPTEGARFGLITTAGTTNTNQFGGTAGTILTQTFSAEEGSTVTVDYNFLTNEVTGGDFIDFGLGELVDGSGNVYQIFAVDTDSFPFFRASGSGYAVQTNWRTAVVTVPFTGTFTLRFVVSDYFDTEFDSALALDNIRVAPRPRLIISEYRLRGPNGANDEFVELFNATPDAITVTTPDGSAGWALANSDGSVRFTVPNGTVIPGYGHYLGVNDFGYSLANYPAGNGTTATGDAHYTTDIPNGAGIALFRTDNPANFNSISRLDAAGYASAPALYREGNGFPTGGAETSTNLEYSFVRSLAAGVSKDTNDNSADFVAVETSGAQTGLGARLGAPGPENLSGPVLRNGSIVSSLLDSQQAVSSPPNRVRNTTPVTNGTAGTLEFRRTFTNNTGSAVTRLRFRVVDITTFPVPTGTADLRALTSSDITVTRTDGSTVLVRGTTLEEPPAQAIGGGLNSTLSAGTITLAAPLAPGANVSVRLVTGVNQNGSFRFFINVEALP